MATFNYVVGRTEAYRSVECGIDIPSLWTATVIQGLPDGKTMNSGSAATAKEAVRFLIHKMKQAGYSGSLKNVGDVTIQSQVKRQPKPVAQKKRKAVAMKVQSSPVKVTNGSKASDTVTIEVSLETDRETVKAYKIYNGAYVGKSICVFEAKGRVSVANNGNGKVRIQRGSITLPVWLYNKF